MFRISISSFLLLVLSVLSQAETFVVGNLNSDGPGSLRAAIEDANQSSTADQIIFASIFETNGPHIISLDAPLTISSSPLQILGPGREQLFISGQSSQRVFQISSGSTADNSHRLENLTIQDGRATLGGANIRAFGSLEIINCTIRNGRATAATGNPNRNTSTNADGGGLFHSGGNLLIDLCLFENNTTTGAFSQGGGVYTESGTALIRNSRIIGNTTNGFVSEGGGIGSRSIMTLENCEISGNETLASSSGGGGIYTDTNITMRQCTISQNIVGEVTGISGYSIGGAFASVGGFAVFEHCTITGNSAPVGAGQGAGISTISTGIISFSHCIVSGNGTSDLDRIPNRQANYRDLGFNLFGIVTNTILNSPANRDATSFYGISAPQLSSLDFHGGVTRTQVPLPGSPALNNGSVTSTLIYDQRRTDFPRLIGAALDIGSCERQDVIDTDLDGIPDSIEALVPGLATSSGDLDHDGVSDALEFRILGSLAILDPALRPSIQILPLADRFQLQFATSPNRECRVTFNTDLSTTRRTLHPGFLTFPSGTESSLEVADQGPRAFFYLEGRIPSEPVE